MKTLTESGTKKGGAYTYALRLGRDSSKKAGDAYEVLESLSKKYGAELQATEKEIFFESGGTRVGIHNSTRAEDHTPTLHIKNGGKNYKIRVSNE